MFGQCPDKVFCIARLASNWQQAFELDWACKARPSLGRHCRFPLPINWKSGFAGQSGTLDQACGFLTVLMRKVLLYIKGLDRKLSQEIKAGITLSEGVTLRRTMRRSLRK